MIPGFPRRRAPGRRWQRGAAAVEFAMMMPVLAFVLVPMILCARYLWHYSVAQKAAQDAARYMSTVSVTEMRSRVLATEAREVAVEIARRELAELAPGEEYPPPMVECDTVMCGQKSGPAPATVRVYLTFNMYDPIFNVYLGPIGTLFEISVEVPYVGR